MGNDRTAKGAPAGLPSGATVPDPAPADPVTDGPPTSAGRPPVRSHVVRVSPPGTRRGAPLSDDAPLPFGDDAAADSPPPFHRFPKRWVRRRLAIRVLIAVGLIAASVFTNRTFVGWGLFVTLAVLIVPVGRTRSFLLSFVPYGAVWFVFSALRSLADETTLAETLNGNVARLERWLFGGQLPTIMLQDRFFDPDRLRWHDYFLTGVHWSYFIVPHLVAIRLWQRNPALFRHYLGAMTLLLAVGLFIYFLIPSNPPWLAPDPLNTPAAAPVTRVMDPVGRHLSGGIYTASYRVIGESNPIAAMPSIHMAITFLLVFAARPARKRWRVLALVYAALMAVALVYLGEHYVVDVAVGMLVTAYGWFAAGTWIGRIAPVLTARLAARGAVAPVPRGAAA